MPHLMLYALEEELAGLEYGLIDELTTAVVSVYGEWAKGSADVRLVGIPVGRWALRRRDGHYGCPLSHLWTARGRFGLWHRAFIARMKASCRCQNATP